MIRSLKITIETTATAFQMFSTLPFVMLLNIDVPHLLKSLQWFSTVSEFTSFTTDLTFFIMYLLANFQTLAALFILAYFCYINISYFCSYSLYMDYFSLGPLGNYSAQIPCHVPHIPSLTQSINHSSFITVHNVYFTELVTPYRLRNA